VGASAVTAAEVVTLRARANRELPAPPPVLLLQAACAGTAADVTGLHTRKDRRIQSASLPVTAMWQQATRSRRCALARWANAGSTASDMHASGRMHAFSDFVDHKTMLVHVLLRLVPALHG